MLLFLSISLSLIADLFHLGGAPQVMEQDSVYAKIALSPCLKVWRRLSKKDRREAILYAPLYVKAQPDKQFRKNPLTFLRQKAWKDELIPSQYATEEQQRRERTDEAERLAQTLAAIGLS